MNENIIASLTLEPMNAVQYDNLELQIRKEQMEDKKGFTAPFSYKIKEWLDLAFMLPKDKKENFIVKEKLTSMIFKIVRSEKRFKSPENIFGEIRYLAVFDRDTNEIGKLISINFENNTANFFTYTDKINGYAVRNKHWRDIYLFDYNSSQIDLFFKDYSRNNNKALTFNEMIFFLEQPDFLKVNTPKFEKGYGVELVKTAEHPVMKSVMLEYKIPSEIVKKPKNKLWKLDATTMEVVEEFDSVKHAAEITVISASTISNVLCTGYSAIKYLLAGGFRWRYSEQLNPKYYWNKKLGKEYSTVSKKEWESYIAENINENDEKIMLNL